MMGIQLRAVAADNAVPNDVMIDELKRLVDGFLGKAMHVCCFDCSLNLMANVRELYLPVAFSGLTQSNKL